VGGIRQQREANDDLERARPQQQPDACARQHAYRGGVYGFHQAVASSREMANGSSAASAAAGALRGLRKDWWASATSISTTAPTTSMYTPRSNSSTLDRCS